MSNHKEHKHASVLRAIADGVPLSEFEVRSVSRTFDWAALYHRAGDMIRFPDQWEVRRKPQYIMVNGFKVPKPLTEKDADNIPSGHYLYAPVLTREELYDCGGNKSIWSYRALGRGILHATEHAAIAHAKAMLGIDPKFFED